MGPTGATVTPLPHSPTALPAETPIPHPLRLGGDSQTHLEAFQVVDVDGPVPTDSCQPVPVCARCQQVNSLRAACRDPWAERNPKPQRHPAPHPYPDCPVPGHEGADTSRRDSHTSQGRKGGHPTSAPTHREGGCGAQEAQQHPSSHLRAAAACAGVCSPPAPAAGRRGHTLERRRQRGSRSRRRTGAGRLEAAAWALWGPGRGENTALAVTHTAHSDTDHASPPRSPQPSDLPEADAVPVAVYAVQLEPRGRGVADPGAAG